MRHVLCFLTSVMLAVPPAEPPPTLSPAIRFPDISVPPPPTPKPDPAVGIVLNADEQYVFDADIETMVASYPAGLLSIVTEAGPMKVKAKFAGGTGKMQTKVFAGKYVTTVEAIGAGPVTLVVVPVGAKSKSEWIEKSILANVGPRPPPTPAPAPTPVDPTTPWKTPTDGLRVLVIEEAGDRPKLPATQLNILFSKTFRDYLNTVTPLSADGMQHEWYIIDKDQDLSAIPKYWADGLALAKGTTPWIVISNGKTGTSEKLPLTTEATLALVKKYEVKP